jgi:hypothetical protein
MVVNMITIIELSPLLPAAAAAATATAIATATAKSRTIQEYKKKTEKDQKL